MALASRVGLGDVSRGFGPTGDARLVAAATEGGWPPAWCGEPRLVSASAGGLRVASLYVPNGRELDHPHYAYKLVWLEELARLAAGLVEGPPAILAGDFNVAPADLDVWSPRAWRGRTHVSVPERDRIAALTTSGWVDLWRDRSADPGFTWWNYRGAGFAKGHGLRIDLALANPAAAALVTAVEVDLVERAAERPSDHAPLVVDLYL